MLKQVPSRGYGVIILHNDIALPLSQAFIATEKILKIWGEIPKLPKKLSKAYLFL